MQAEMGGAKGLIQAKLDGVIERSQGLREFTREGVLHAVTQFVACDDQVSIVNRDQPSAHHPDVVSRRSRLLTRHRSGTVLLR